MNRLLVGAALVWTGAALVVAQSAPAEGQYVGFTTWLAGSMDRAWEGRSTPGRYVMHRLNRSEYANVVRDLFGLDIDFTELLPSDGANFGFDNNAASLKTSPLLLER